VHAWQRPEQGVSQQTPSTQLPLEHCEAEVHMAPLAWSGWHVPSEILHQLVATHEASLVHAVAHELTLAQVKGAQLTAAPALHVPNPSQA
jgi:hypothetical protein